VLISAPTLKVGDRSGAAIVVHYYLTWYSVINQQKLVAKFKQKLSNQFIKNIGWLTGAELLNRVFRLATTVILARSLSPYDYGLVAIVFTTIEFANLLTLRGGIGSKLIQVPDAELEQLANTAYWLNWIICGAIFVLQCLAAFPIAWFYNNTQIILPVCTVATVYLVMPISLVQTSLIQRENRLKIFALSNAVAIGIGNVLTVCFALLGWGAWAVIAPFVITTPIWSIFYLKYCDWRPTGAITLARWQDLLLFSKDPVGIELLDKIRANLDYLIIGRFLGVEALGLYYFAFNAGLGISLSIMANIWTALFPHLCEARGNLKLLREKYFSSLKAVGAFFIPLVLLQTGLAPLYVPIVFGHRWIGAIPILMLICLSALFRPFGSAAAQLLLTVGKGELSLYWNLIFTVIFTIAIFASVQWGIMAVAIAVFLVHTLAIPPFVAWATQQALPKNALSQFAE
jgi:O-antigen/teichoic acid export membrane protein